jgi:hypothetical protein
MENFNNSDFIHTFVHWFVTTPQKQLESKQIIHVFFLAFPAIPYQAILFRCYSPFKLLSP